MSDPIPSSDLSALVALARASAASRQPEVDLSDFTGWLSSSSAKRLAPFVFRREPPSDQESQDLQAAYRAVLMLSGTLRPGSLAHGSSAAGI